MRKLLAAGLTGSALAAASVASPVTAAPNENACHERPNGASHGSVHAHHTVPEKNHQAHSSIPKNCDYPD
ncbi:MAG: hypothetical protein LC808_35455 [Actinobacteria bacterium]|nr:hypothetical protein [Actinomycetota bacterium]